jgi:hypothetical protein
MRPDPADYHRGCQAGAFAVPLDVPENDEAPAQQLEFQRLPAELMASVLQFPIDDLDVRLWMVLFHTHVLRFRSPIAGVAILAGWTQRVAAVAVADSWPDRSDVRATYAYWYEEYVRRTPYQTFEAVPPRPKGACSTASDSLEIHAWLKWFPTIPSSAAAPYCRPFSALSAASWLRVISRRGALPLTLLVRLDRRRRPQEHRPKPAAPAPPNHAANNSPSMNRCPSVERSAISRRPRARPAVA